MYGSRKWAVTALGMVCAAAVGALLARPSKTTPPPPASAGPTPRLAAVEAKLDRLLAGAGAGAGGGAAAWTATAAEVTRLREELAALRQEVADVSPPAPGEPELPPARAAAAIAARDRARTLIDGARRARRWGDGERDALRAVVDQLTPADRDRMVTELFHALNQQEIALESEGPPL
jgi:hypothetical protein